MRYLENECVNCGFPCIFEACPNFRVEHFKCDYCGAEDIRLYEYGGDEICEECLLEEFSIVEGTESY